MFYNKTIEEIETELNTGINGITEEEAKKKNRIIWKK